MYGVIGINFVDHFLNQGAPAEHKSAETPIGHESISIFARLSQAKFILHLRNVANFSFLSSGTPAHHTPTMHPMLTT